MYLHFRAAAVFTCLTFPLAAGPANAQSQPSSADVTFVVPLDLTNLPVDITKVQVRCEISSGSLAGSRAGVLEISVTGGQVVQTAASAHLPNVVVPVPASALLPGAAGRSASYMCKLSGYSPAYGWHELTVKSNSELALLPPPFRLSPQPASLTGTFQW